MGYRLLSESLKEKLNTLIEQQSDTESNKLKHIVSNYDSFFSLLKDDIVTTDITSSMNKEVSNTPIKSDAYAQLAISYKDELDKVRITRQKNLSLITQNFLEKRNVYIESKEKLPKNQQSKKDEASLAKQIKVDALQIAIYDAKNTIKSKKKKLESEYATKITAIKKTHETTNAKLTQAILKEKNDFSKKTLVYEEKIAQTRVQSSENYASIKQTYTQASISFNQKINDLKLVLQENLASLKENYDSKILSLETKKEQYLETHNIILNKANLDFQNILNQHNTIFDDIKKEYELEKNKIDFEYHNGISIITSKLNTYRDEQNDKIKIIQKDQVLPVIKNRKIKELNRSVNKFILKSNESLKTRQSLHHKNVYQNELDYLKKLYNWRFEHAKLDLEHKQSMLVLENEKNLFNEKIDIEKGQLESLYLKHIELNELSHLNNISPLELQLKIASSIQDRENALLVNDSKHIEEEINADFSNIKNAHAYKLNALNYQMSISDFTREYDERIAVLSFQLENEKLKREIAYHTEKNELEKQLAALSYDLSILDDFFDTELNFFDITHSQEILSSLYSISSSIEKELSIESSIIINKSMEILKAKKSTHDDFGKIKKIIDKRSFYSKDLNNSIENFNNYITSLIDLNNYLLNYQFENKCISNDLIDNLLQENLSDAFIILESILGKISNYVIDELLYPQYESLFQHYTNLYHHNLSVLNFDRSLLKRKITFIESQIMERVKSLESIKKNQTSTSENLSLTTRLIFKKHIREDEKISSQYKNILSEYDKKEDLLKAKYETTIQILKKEHLFLIKKTNNLSLKIDNDVRYYYSRISDLFSVSSSNSKLNNSSDILKYRNSLYLLNNSLKINLSKKISLFNNSLLDIQNNRLKLISFSLLQLEDSLKSSDKKLKECRLQLDKDKSYLLYKANVELDAVKKIKHTELLTRFTHDKNMLEKNYAYLLDSLLKRDEQLTREISLIDENFKTSYSTLKKEHNESIFDLNRKLKNSQVALTSLNHKTTKDLELGNISLNRKNSIILQNFNTNYKKNIKLLEHEQKNYKIRINRLNHSILYLKELAPINFIKLKRTNYRNLIILKKAFTKKLLVNKKEIRSNYQSELQELKKSEKFKKRSLK